jgi:hypothetical protein
MIVTMTIAITTANIVITTNGTSGKQEPGVDIGGSAGVRNSPGNGRMSGSEESTGDGGIVIRIRLAQTERCDYQQVLVFQKSSRVALNKAAANAALHKLFLREIGGGSCCVPLADGQQ